jgi:hypothetical protein
MPIPANQPHARAVAPSHDAEARSQFGPPGGSLGSRRHDEADRAAATHMQHGRFNSRFLITINAAPMAASFAYFFALLAGYYVLRPLRDEMGIVEGYEIFHG